MKKLLLCSAIGNLFGPPLALAPADTGMTMGGIGLGKEKVLGRDDMMAGVGLRQMSDPMHGAAMEPEGLRRGAVAVDTDLNGEMSISDATVPLAKTAKLATCPAEMLAT